MPKPKQIQNAAKTPPTGILKWYNALHGVTADMARNWFLNKDEPKVTLNEWARVLKEQAKEMEAMAKRKKL